ncbi:diphosphomevalonate decarboxylase [Nocardia sp. NPDC003345]
MSREEPAPAPTEDRRGPDTGALAVAYPNMALVKYWGKRDEELILPVTGSLSMTLDIFPTTTRVVLRERAATDSVRLNGRRTEARTRIRVERFLDLVRDLAGRSERARVITENTVPTGAGLASSASGFAALAAAASAAYGLRLDRRTLSRLARRGSGSACRSIFGGFVLWHAGAGFGAAGDESCYAEPVHADIDPAMVIAVVDAGPKTLPSRTAMRQSIATSPLYRSWARSNNTALEQIQAALDAGDLTEMGAIAEQNALGMHATMLSARPSIRYLAPRSLSVLDRVDRIRAAGVPAYATIDAGPNVAVLCARRDAEHVVAELSEVDGVAEVRVAHQGPGVNVSELNR